jgi:pilus assembly protein Flp/PilA
MGSRTQSIKAIFKRSKKMFKTKRNKKEKGQGLVEYALILVLVAIVVIAVLMLLGPIIGNVFSSINSSLSGATSGGGAPAAAADPYAAYADDIMASGTFNAQDAINQWCYGKPSGTPYKHYYWTIGSNLLGGVNTSAPSNYYLYGTGTCS